MRCMPGSLEITFSSANTSSDALTNHLFACSPYHTPHFEQLRQIHAYSLEFHAKPVVKPLASGRLESSVCIRAHPVGAPFSIHRRQALRMGRSFWFDCVKCGYRANVSGGADRGLNICVQTVLCRECRALFDAVTHLRIPHESGLQLSWTGLRRPNFPDLLRKWDAPPSFPSVLNLLPYQGVKRFRWLHFKLRCPVSALHPVQAWNEPGKCPCCRVYLEKNAVPFRIWE